MKHTFEFVKDSVSLAQGFVNRLIHPKPLHVLLEKVYIPRRPLEVDGHVMLGSEVDCLKAEFVDWQKSLENCTEEQCREFPVLQEKEKIILFCHGGGYTLCSRKTHRGLTWRISKYANARVLCKFYFYFF
jgi:hypothetical protein